MLVKPVLECFLSNLFMQDLAFVLDGWALEIILKHSKESFTRLAMLSRTAICCRMTPLQKAQVYILLFMIIFLLTILHVHESFTKCVAVNQYRSCFHNKILDGLL
jgi:magnesium-transporting ATPase (P-type)